MRSDRRKRILAVLVVGATGLAATATLHHVRTGGSATASVRRGAALPPVRPTDIGINLFGLAPHNRQQVFADMTAQSEWFTTTGAGWTPMPAAQIDPRGWIRFLSPGQAAPRPLVLPPVPFSRAPVRCRFAGRGRLSTGGIAHMTERRANTIDLVLISTGAADEGGWVQLDATDPADPLRDLDCRDPRVDVRQVYDRIFLDTLSGFAAVRFLDWQRVNDNPVSRWNSRVLPGDSSQAGPGGVAIEHMVRLANEAGVDPWFLLPYAADAAYVAGFARQVHATLAPGRTVYVELGNEIWNDMFPAARQARDEGVAARLAGPGDPFRAQMRRYAQKARSALRIWTAAYADRPARLVRVVGAHNAYPEAAAMILEYEDMARWTDALAIAPYIHLDIAGRGTRDVDPIFAEMGQATDATLDFAEQNRRIATRHGKRLIAYEGGQHLLTRDMDLATLVQRDPRMAAVYARYLNQWRTRIGDRMMLYASTAPIGDYGAWGLREYAGQPDAQTPKLRAVRAFLSGQKR